MNNLDLLETIKNLDKVMEMSVTSLDYDGEDVVLDTVYEEPDNFDQLDQWEAQMLERVHHQEEAV